MSEKLGPVTYGDVAQEIFVGHTISQHKTVSEATAQEIDKENRLIVDQAYTTAQGILKKHLSQLHLIASQLLEHETLSGDDIRSLIQTGEIHRMAPQEKSTRKTSLDPSQKEALCRIEYDGANELKPPCRSWVDFLKRFKNPIILLLLGICIVAFFLGEIHDC